MLNRPSDDALITALKENFAHARHQEYQRERYTYLYWIIWGAVLTLVSRQGDLSAQVQAYQFMFLFLAILSLATLILNLKWNAEFANHIVAAGNCSGITECEACSVARATKISHNGVA